MTRIARFAAFGALLALGLAAPSSAATPNVPEGKDPNEIVCEKQTVLGSRLAVKRKCLTRAQWAEQRLVNKETVDGLQRGGSTCTVGKKC